MYSIGTQIPLSSRQTAEKGKMLTDVGTFFPHWGKKVSQMENGKRWAKEQMDASLIREIRIAQRA